MASVFKHIEIVGTIGNVYELRSVGSDNRSVVDFSVAVTPRKRVGDEWEDGTTIWTNCTAWGRTADNIAEGFKKGDRVFLKGRADMKAGYTNKDGVEVAPREIVVVDYAGHENSYRVSTQIRDNAGGGGSGSRSTQAAPKQAAAKPKAAPAAEAIDFDEFDIDDLDDGDLPF